MRTPLYNRAVAHISLILPAIDETNSLEETVRLSRKALSSHDLEFLIVTSPAFTTGPCLRTIENLTTNNPDIRHIVQTLPGVGGAIRNAFDVAKGEYTVLMASDLETDPVALPALIQKLEDGFDIAATTRWRGGAHFVGYHPVKLVFNYAFQKLFRILYWTDLTDMTYAYRAYRTPIVKRIRWEETRHPFLFESIVKPLRLGYRVTEVDTSWKARSEGVSHGRLTDTLNYAKVGLRVRFMPASELVY